MKVITYNLQMQVLLVLIWNRGFTKLELDVWKNEMSMSRKSDTVIPIFVLVLMLLDIQTKINCCCN